MKGYYTIKQARDGQYYFTLNASNGIEMAESHLYTTKAACENGISSIQRIGTTEDIRDLT